MPPGGEVQLTGLAAPMMFFGPALQRLGLAVEVEAAGIYKSFGEPYTRAYPTRANREATDHLKPQITYSERLGAHRVSGLSV